MMTSIKDLQTDITLREHHLRIKIFKDDIHYDSVQTILENRIVKTRIFLQNFPRILIVDFN